MENRISTQWDNIKYESSIFEKKWNQIDKWPTTNVLEGQRENLQKSTLNRTLLERDENSADHFRNSQIHSKILFRLPTIFSFWIWSVIRIRALKNGRIILTDFRICENLVDSSGIPWIGYDTAATKKVSSDNHLRGLQYCSLRDLVLMRISCTWRRQNLADYCVFRS